MTLIERVKMSDLLVLPLIIDFILTKDCTIEKLNFKNILNRTLVFSYGILKLSHSYMFLLINKDNIYYLFNCYCCSPKGLFASRGYACLKSFKSILVIPFFQSSYVPFLEAPPN